MKIKIYLTLFILCLSAMAFSQETDNRANASMQEEIKMYHEALNLSGEQLYHVSQFLAEKLEKNEVIVAEIDKLKKQLDNIDVSTDKQIMGILNEDQRVIMQEKLEEKLAKQHEEFKESLTD